MNNNIINTFLSGISKSLNIADNIIPIYKDTYPLIKKGKDFLNKTNYPNKLSPKLDNNSNNIPNTEKKNSSNNPKFFI